MLPAETGEISKRILLTHDLLGLIKNTYVGEK